MPVILLCISRLRISCERRGQYEQLPCRLGKELKKALAASRGVYEGRPQAGREKDARAQSV